MGKLQRKSHLSSKPNRSGEPLKIAFTQDSNKLTWKNPKLGLSSAPDSPKAAGDVPQQPASMWLGSSFRRREERRDGWDPASIAREGSLQQAMSGRISASKGETNGGTRERERRLCLPGVVSPAAVSLTSSFCRLLYKGPSPSLNNSSTENRSYCCPVKKLMNEFEKTSSIISMQRSCHREDYHHDYMQRRKEAIKTDIKEGRHYD
ncbi:hypothetical protein MRB53_014209 [Persea americana]|uniref:Uncharacterized protein n=1 Tax=Persea americana TaxID=3435 RepID=A0ACC2KA57_PERAE|nr:hypothetical protein MRB53_014209 [Persea americana]